MDLKILIKAARIKARASLSFGKRFAKSYVSLFLVMIIAVGSTAAWFAQRKAVNLGSGNLQFNSASSLRISKDDYAYSKFFIENIKLDEASSVDGRNIYFPLGESFNTNTSDMQFREANTGDKNVRYIYTDLKLRGSSSNTPVYIKSYKITICNQDGSFDTGADSVTGVYQDELVIVDSNGNPIGGDNTNTPYDQKLPPDYCPIRIAFISDSSLDPIVIDPSAQSEAYVEDTNDAVALIDDNGYPVSRYGLQDRHVDSFASYYYGTSHPLFTIPGGRELTATMVVWLEGSFENSDAYIGKYISIDIDIESNFADMEKITFIDETTGDTDENEHYWVSNDNPTMAISYKDPYSDEGRYKTVIMVRQSDDTSSADYRKWVASIPKSALSDISFYRLAKAADRDDSSKYARHGTIYNSWHTCTGVNNMLKSDINLNWFYPAGNKNLQEKRRIIDNTTGGYYNATTYVALRGNGYGPSNVSSERLAPCVGYWGYTGPAAGGGTVVVPTTPSGGGSSSTYSTNVYFNVNDNLSYIYQQANGGVSGAHVYFHTGSGGEYQMTPSANNRFSATYDLAAGDTIDYFYLMYAGGSTETYYMDTNVSKFVVNGNSPSFYFSNVTNKKLSYS